MLKDENAMAMSGVVADLVEGVTLHPDRTFQVGGELEGLLLQ